MIRLLESNADGTLGFREVDVESSTPSYAILSHTWGAKAEELSYTDVLHGKNKDSPGYQKIQFCLRQAADHGLRYCWVDTCCIDKTNSAELSEAIISMFRWYKNAARCYAYLSDVSDDASDPTNESALKHSRWFTRGWTLQELLAPRTVDFFSKKGTWIGDKNTLATTIHEITKIPVEALRGGDLTAFSVDERMSWIGSRKTTREEDGAYCLLGIFDVTLIPAYGEGANKAFRRLRQEIQSLNGTTGLRRERSDDGDHSVEALPTKRQKLERELVITPEQTRLIFNSLRYDEIESRRLTIKTAHIKTCAWLLQDSQYLDWLDDQKQHEHGGFLWIKGHPGCGKSTIMKFAVTNARKQMTDHIQLSFFFNARGGDLEKSVAGAYRTLLIQLLEKVPTLQSVFHELGSSALKINANHEWDTETLEHLLREAVKQLTTSSIVCFIDALDESDTEEIRKMLSFLESLCQQTLSASRRIRVCLASRHYPHITISKGLILELDIKEGHRQDIVNYLSTELRIGHDEPTQRVRSEVMTKANGIFIWVVLVVDILNKEYDRGRIQALERRLAELPADVYQLFQDILTRDPHRSDQRAELGLCIQWVLFSRNPLTARQLCAAVSFGIEGRAMGEEEGEHRVSMSNGDVKRYVLDVSRGLTEIIPATQKKDATVQFIHESVKDFFLKEKGFHKIWPEFVGDFEGQSHERLRKCCLDYMVLGQHQLRTRAHILRHKRFFEYAVKYVLYHADQAAGKDISQDKFMRDFPLSQWVTAANKLEPFSIRDYTAGVSLGYILAEQNLPHLIRAIEPPVDHLEENNERHRCPLFACFANGHKEAARAFLERDAMKHDNSSQLMQRCSQIFSNDRWRGEFGLNFADSKKAPILVYLADLADINTLAFLTDLRPECIDQCEDATGAFVIAACCNLKQFLASMLQRGAKLDMEGLEKPCKVLEALEIETSGILGKLYYALSGARSVQTTSTSYGSHNLISTLVAYGFIDIVELILDSGLYVERPASLCEPLRYAAFRGLGEVVGMLIARGAPLDAFGVGGQTALHIACRRGHVDIARTLLKSGADVNLFTNAPIMDLAPWYLKQEDFEGVSGTTALCIACELASEPLVKLLLENGADPNAAGGRDRLPLYVACLKVDRSVTIPRLLERGVDIDAISGRGQTALLAACLHENVKAVELLLAKGADPHIATPEGALPLTCAVYSENPESIAIVQLLLAGYTHLNATHVDDDGDDVRVYAMVQARAILDYVLEHTTDELAKQVYDQATERGIFEPDRLLLSAYTFRRRAVVGAILRHDDAIEVATLQETGRLAILRGDGAVADSIVRTLVRRDAIDAVVALASTRKDGS